MKFLYHGTFVVYGIYMTIRTPVCITTVLETFHIYSLYMYERLHLQTILRVIKIYIQICVYTELNFCQTVANIHFSNLSVGQLVNMNVVWMYLRMHHLITSTN